MKSLFLFLLFLAACSNGEVSQEPEPQSATVRDSNTSESDEDAVAEDTDVKPIYMREGPPLEGIGQLVTPPSVHAAAKRYATRLVGPPSEYTTLGRYEVKEGFFFARSFAYNALIEGYLKETGFFENGGDPDAWLPWMSKWRDEALLFARTHLSEPDALNATYEEHKETVLIAIEVANAEKAIRRILNGVIIYSFERTVPKNILELQDEAAQIDARIDQICSENDASNDDICLTMWRHQRNLGQDFEVEAAKAGFPSAYLLQFRLRRHSEGGDALVSTYLALARDFERSLP